MFSQNCVDLTDVMSTCMSDNNVEIYSFYYEWHCISPGTHSNVSWTESYRTASKLLKTETSLACDIRLYADTKKWSYSRTRNTQLNAKYLAVQVSLNFSLSRPEIEPRSTACNANILPTDLFVCLGLDVIITSEGSLIFLSIFGIAIKQWGFFNVPHVLWHGPTVNSCHLRGPVTLKPVDQHLAEEMSLRTNGAIT